MPAERLLIDTCVLLEATDLGRRGNRAARDLLERHDALVFPAQVAREYLVVATRPREANGLGVTAVQALENLESIRENVRLLSEEKPLLPVLLGLVRTHSLTGKRIHDAHIVAAAMAHGVKRIATLNIGDFRPFLPEVTCLDPAAALRSHR